MQQVFGFSSRDDASEWLSVSDLMAGLMVIFLFIAIVFIRPLAEENIQLTEQKDQLEDLQKRLEEQSEQLRREKLTITEIAVAWQEQENKIFEALLEEFKDDLPTWNAEIERDTLLIRFKAPDVLFETGRAVIRSRFTSILSDFFPRYVRVLAPFRNSIDEVRIEGHTSSIWNQSTDKDDAYFLNMGLSQARTRAVLQNVLGLDEVADERPWLQSIMTANGLSSSKPVLRTDGTEDRGLSRRVEFRVRTTARTEIVRILEAAQ